MDHCAKHYTETVPNLQSDNGRVRVQRFVVLVRHFRLRPLRDNYLA